MTNKVNECIVISPAGLGEEGGDDGVGNGEDEERTAEVVGGDLEGEREAREEPRKKEESDAEFENAKRLRNAVNDVHFLYFQVAQV